MSFAQSNAQAIAIVVNEDAITMADLKARMDMVTSFCLVFYLVCLLIGSVSSTIYAIETGQRKFSQWNPSMIPIKVIMVTGIALMLLQAISMFFKDLAKAKGKPLS